MSNVRRWYIYIVCAISLQAVAWAIIALLRNMFVFGIEPLAVAFQIAVIIIGLPVFLAHWLWAQRLAGKIVDEREAALRRFYLYGNMAAFLGPFLTNAFDLIRQLMGEVNQYQGYEYNRLSMGDAVVYHLTAVIVLAVLWFYHWQVAADDSRAVGEAGSSATVRRLYVLGFSAAGLIMVTQAVIHLIRWLMLDLGGSAIRDSGLSVALSNEITRLIIGVPLWVIFWRWAQRLFDGPSEAERLSTLRKFYLYAAVFVGILSAVTSATGILAGLFRRILDLAPKGDIRQPLPILIGMVALWIYHVFVLRDDAKQAGEAPRQAGVRRLYLYLTAAVGLSALLVGLSGDISVILRAYDTIFGPGPREQFAWYTAAIIAGLPVWIIPWRQTQEAATLDGPVGADARRSVVRKIYLYFFLFVATMTMLSGAVYILFRILSMVLGEDAPTLTQLGQAISFSLIAAAVWVYHGNILRSDGRLTKLEQSGLLEALRVVVMDVGGDHFGSAVVEQLKRDFPEISLEPILLGPDTKATVDEKNITAQLTNAGLIVGPWNVAVNSGVVSDKVAAAVVASSARKLLVPTQSSQWDWAGVDRWDSESLVNQTVRAVKQVLAGEEVKAHRPMSAGSVIGIVIGVLFLLILLAIPLLMYFLF
jgi:hypothetical protein